MTSLFPDNWSALSTLVDAVLDAPRDQRQNLISQLTKGDASLKEQLEQLVNDCDRESEVLDRPAAETFATLFIEPAAPEITGMLGDRYRIEREVGRGGMARVYLARDIKHDRDVAVKVIAPDIAASLGGDRFLQEIAVVARLRHPNIVPMYDSGERDGVLYFVMPYEEGPSLKKRLATPPPISSAERISILRDIARALAYAHEQGLVHRDIKPDNVLLSGGAAVVADFGIAKAVSAAQSAPSSGVITQSGARIGTPAYMAPEQAVGDPTTDHRADIYSFGCVAYELYAGRPPFVGFTSHEVIAAHVGATPAPIRTEGSAVPRAIEAMIMRCLNKLPADRPQSARELLEVLESNDGGIVPASRERSRMPRSAMVGAAVIVLGLLGAFAYKASRTTKIVAAAPAELSVAVLPLITGADSLQRELAYGLSDEIAIALVKVPGVRVMSRRGVAASRESGDVDPAITGKALGAQYLVMGSLRQSAGRLTVLARLVRANDGAMLWADQYDRSLDDLGAIREMIAKSVGDSLRRRSGISGVAGVSTRRPSPPGEPYRLYVLGQRALNLRGRSIGASVDLFRHATELDTLYAEAFSGLSLALALSPYFQPISAPQVAGNATAAARRALRLDPTLGLPHVALGLVHMHAYQWDSAQTEFETAVRLRDPGDVEPLVQYGRYLIFRARTREALTQFLIARNTEPASALV
ncbi:MAG TPA: serine/threonine-protein kinase, partial [Gemmatimonadaceae bacterium]|nr:serine/threonine-protein kinase [Gemmatimonadaceae bacterium]